MISCKRVSLLAGLFVPLRLHQLLFILRSELWLVNAERDLLELAGERERRLVVLVVDPGQGVGTDIETLVELQQERQRVLHLLLRDHLAVDLERADAAAADATHVIEGERREAQSVILEVELKHVLAGAERFASLPPHALQTNQVPGEHRLVL